ncbi:MAG: NAD(P)-dependent oxidoreductase [Firmicutes bacterium]|nr:NAD(P)-dependent oxidoreductase [Bacillota bacterium]
MDPLSFSDQWQEEVHPDFSLRQAQMEAQRCLYCYDAPCRQACPTAIDVPRFIRAVASQDFKTAQQEILSANGLGDSCARICPTEVLCEGACVLGANESPIAIGQLQRYALKAGGVLQPFAIVQDKSQKVAIVGSGPAGLSCAYQLAQLGYRVEVFEKRDVAGGLNAHGIVSYRLPSWVAAKEVERVKAAGVVMHTSVTVGVDRSWEEMEKTFDAVILAVGAGSVPHLNIPGEDLPEVYDALEIIAQSKAGTLSKKSWGNRVIVVGAGNTAVDVATLAKRMGVEHVQIVYRRGPEAMPVYPSEYAFAKASGVSYQFWTQPVAVAEQDGHVAGLQCVRTTSPDAGSRRGTLQMVPSSEFFLPAASIIRAIGQERPAPLWEALGIVQQHGRPVVQPQTFESSRPGFFVIGDALQSSDTATVVDAVQQGKQAAHALHAQWFSHST